MSEIKRAPNVFRAITSISRELEEIQEASNEELEALPAIWNQISQKIRSTEVWFEKTSAKASYTRYVWSLPVIRILKTESDSEFTTFCLVEASWICWAGPKSNSEKHAVGLRYISAILGIFLGSVYPNGPSEEDLISKMLTTELNESDLSFSLLWEAAKSDIEESKICTSSYEQFDKWHSSLKDAYNVTPGCSLFSKGSRPLIDCPKEIRVASFESLLFITKEFRNGLMSANRLDLIQHVGSHPKALASYDEARNFVSKLDLESKREWFEYVSGKKPNLLEKPESIPNFPNLVYRNSGWSGWSDFLGITLDPQCNVENHAPQIFFQKSISELEGEG